MHPIVQLILLAYTLEGIKSRDVAILISREGGATVFRCMAPQQHNANRAVGIKQRVERQVNGDEHAVECEVQPGQVYHEGAVQAMHTVVVHYFSKVC